MAIKFEKPFKAFSVPDDVEKSDFEEPVWVFDAHGIRYDQVYDQDGEKIGHVGNVYVHDDVIVMKLNSIAAEYHAAYERLQQEWRDVLSKAVKVTVEDNQ
jgi:hypothetical protein